ncbi:MAG: SIR2 family protein [Defluviicoccus sp.]|nr:SIR2 family protein [Defluviicoccus sp.]MDE0279106.1 SIR2 family protein [Defluviicoccus sp.]
MNDRTVHSHPDSAERTISLAPDLPAIPERLLLAHARGDVLFLCGAGISMSAGLPDFKQLVLDVYRILDPSVCEILTNASIDPDRPTKPDCPALNDRQSAEVECFNAGEYDVVLGMLERRLDSHTREDSKVRSRVVEILRSPIGKPNPAMSRLEAGAARSGNADASGTARPAAIHRTLIRLADRGGATTIMTTNFDLLLERAARNLRVPAQSYALGSIPRPARRREFAGVLHIHGALTRNPSRHSDLILTDQDFGEYYLRRRVVPDLVYDTARLFHLILVGYSANDPPMRYLLNAVAADEGRFDDLKERFIFVGSDEPDAVALQGWRARGIVPIRYDASDGDHTVLLRMLQRWADLSAINGKQQLVHREIRRIVKSRRADAPDADLGLFDHLFRRASPDERVRLAEVASAAGAEPAWLDAILSVSAERERQRNS